MTEAKIVLLPWTSGGKRLASGASTPVEVGERRDVTVVLLIWTTREPGAIPATVSEKSTRRLPLRLVQIPSLGSTIAIWRFDLSTTNPRSRTSTLAPAGAFTVTCRALVAWTSTGIVEDAPGARCCWWAMVAPFHWIRADVAPLLMTSIQKS